MSFTEKTCIVIAGPTAVGKSAIAAQIAHHFNTVVISADSRQCYKDMSIGVARPEPELLKLAPHYFVADRSIHQPLTAADFEREALPLTEKIFQEKDVVILTGGTGLYIKAYCEGMDDIVSPDPLVREEVQKIFDEEGIEGLQRTIQHLDPLFAQQGEMQNPRRIMRAIEVMKMTGNSILSLHNHKSSPRNFKIISFCLNLPREVLYERINLRVDQMMEQGLLEEAQGLYPYKHLQALQTVGYQEVFDYMDGKLTLEQAIDKIKQHSRNYAKRQITWFKKQQGMKMVNASFPEVLKEIEESIKS